MSKKLIHIEIEGIKLQSHTITDKRTGEKVFGFMQTLPNGKMGFLSADRLAKFQKGLRESADQLSNMLRENVAYTSKGFDVSFGEANPPQGVTESKPRSKSKKQSSGDLDFEAILNQVSVKTVSEVKATPPANTQVEKPVDNHDIFDALSVDVGF